MKAHFEIIQGTSDWLQLKYGKIGGTLAKGLFVKSDTLLDEILANRLEPFFLEDDGYESSDMVRGKELEPYARNQASQYLGIEFLECGWLQSEEIPLLGISPDGITSDFKIQLEAKCPSKKKHTNTIRLDEIPNDNIHQCVHAFTVNPHLEKLVFVSFRPESVKPLFLKELFGYSLVNLGTPKTPIVKSVNDWVKISKENAINLDKQILECIEKINGI